MDRPRRRYVDFFPAQVHGRQMVGVRDPAGLLDGTVMLPPEVFFILSLCDGRHTISEIQVEYVRRFGNLIFTDQLQRIIEDLDNHLLLDSDRYRAVEYELAQAFRAEPVREATHAGSAYPEDPDALRAFLSSLIDQAKPIQAPAARIRGIAAPHIDLQRGGPVYGAAYRAVRDHVKADLFVILGIAHSGGQTPFILTKKHFSTPLGTLNTDAKTVQRLAAACPFDPFSDELVHKSEHSIEFQLIFLQHCFGDDVRIVPILCNEVEGLMPDGDVPASVPSVACFLNALREVVEEAGERVCVIAGVDLSHVGQQFGDAGRLSPGFLELTERGDRRILERLAAGDADEAYRLCYAEGNRQHVCGMPALYALAYALSECTGTVLAYHQAVTWQVESAVTMAAMVLC